MSLGGRKASWWASAVAVAVGSYYVFSYVQKMSTLIGVGLEYENKNTSSCRKVGQGVLHGCEDIVVDPGTGMAYLACGAIKPRQHWLLPDMEYDLANEVEKDHIYIMDEKDRYSELKAMERTADGSLVPFTQDFRVHGFDIYWDPVDPGDMTFMFVNHQLDHNAISIFSHKRGSDYLEHVETVKSPLLHSPNNIVAMSKRAFYATNDMMFTRGVLRELTNNLGMPLSHVVYRGDDGEFSVVAKNIRYANGIARNGKFIYVASCMDPGIQIYTIGDDHMLEYQGRTIFPDSVPDNVFVDKPTGHVYATGFLRLLEVGKFFHEPSFNGSSTCAAEVLRLTQDEDPKKGFAIEKLLQDSGHMMPTATIAAIQRRNGIERMLVGCVVCDAVVACDQAH